MCNEFGNTIPYSAYVEEFSDLRLPLLAPPSGAIPNLEPLASIRPTDRAPILRAASGGAALALLRWGFVPARPKAGPVINLRSEGRSFREGRCLVPASYFFEFTGQKYPKTKWRFSRAGADWFCFAGLWRAESSGEDRFALLTTSPGPDMAPYHDRQPVILNRDLWGAWLDPAAPAGDLLGPSPAGSLEVEEVRRG